MKKSYYMPFILSFVFLFSSCKKEIIPTELSLSVTSNPQGGISENSVSCSFDGSVSVPDQAVQVTVEWWWEDENHENTSLKESEQITFSSENTVSKSTVYSAGEANDLIHFYWVKFKWTDDSGTHEIESDKAYFASSVNLNLSVVTHPQGGTSENSVSCTYEGSLNVSDQSVQVTVEWWWENDNHEDAVLKSSEQVTFDSDSPILKSTEYSADPGYILMNYYWVKLKWTDGLGSHELESEKAYFASSVLLDLSILTHPQGGTMITSVSCTYEGSVNVPDQSIQVAVEWWWEDGNHGNATLKSSEQVTFDSESPVTKSTVYSAAPGYILLNYYWVKFKWTDDAGAHEIESEKAYCETGYK